MQAQGVTGRTISGADERRLVLFSGRGNPELGEKLAEELHLDLGAVTLKTFSAGEVYCRYDEPIRGADVFILQSTCGNPETGITANDALMELLLMIDAARGASARRVIAVMPWFSYSRQDSGPRPASRSARGWSRTCSSRSASTGSLTVDLHASQVQGSSTSPSTS